MLGAQAGFQRVIGCQAGGWVGRAQAAQGDGIIRSQGHTGRQLALQQRQVGSAGIQRAALAHGIGQGGGAGLQPSSVVLTGGESGQLCTGGGKSIGCDLLALCGQLGAGLHTGGAQLTVGAGMGAVGLKVERMLGLGLLGLARFFQLALDLGIGLGADGGAGGFALGPDGFEEPLGAGI